MQIPVNSFFFYYTCFSGEEKDIFTKVPAFIKRLHFPMMAAIDKGRGKPL